jgi:hypothetical protein
MNCIGNDCAVQSLVELVVGSTNELVLILSTKWGLIKDQSMAMFKRSVKTFAPTLKKNCFLQFLLSFKS